MELHLVNTEARYPKAPLVEPTTLGYIYLAARVRPGRSPLVLPSAERSRLLVKLKALAQELERVDGVLKATAFRAIVTPPTARFSAYLKERGDSLEVARFDVVLLVQTTSPRTARDVRETPEFCRLLRIVESEAEVVHSIAARNARRIGDVDTARGGLFLFNHFAAAVPGVMLQLWEYLAGWYVAETGLDNSVALVPEDGEEADYAIVNWARWDESPLRHFWHQLSKKTFWRYVTANLDANHAAAMPIYCRLA